MSAARVPATEESTAVTIGETAPIVVAEERGVTSLPSVFTVGERDFLLNGRPLQVLSGAIHYFRVHPDQWADRIRKARQMGLNTIETYVAWNAHAPRENEFDMTGGLDLGQFLDLVAAEGMHAIVRPGPYVCAEWDNGGLPAWLFRNGKAGIRRDEPIYLSAVEAYYRKLAPVLGPRQIDRGGPIILVQIENEYGAYGRDKSYLRKLVELTRDIGITVPLTTVDQPVDDMLENGSIPGLHKTGSFGSRVNERLDILRRHQTSGPLMCSEFWDGWFDDWGTHHHRTPVAQTAEDLDTLLSRGASVNIYMFHGGTNFGFTNGANDKGTYQPIITSYDYDAPLNEAGNPTEKYWAFRDILTKYGPPTADRPEPAGPTPVFASPLRRAVPLWEVVDQLGRWQWRSGAPTADELGQYNGFTLYRAEVDLPEPTVLHVGEVRDRAQVFLNRRSVGVLARDHHDHALVLPGSERGVLELLVEDQGRVDYGPRLGEPKGLIAPITLDSAPLERWETLPLNLRDLEPIEVALRSAPNITPVSLAGPIFASTSFNLNEITDLYLDTSGWGKGVVWINGFCLGRYWSRGPQHTLYVPGPVLRETGNELIILELHATTMPTASFVAGPDLGHLES